jgi:outer membrane lipoprotein-sorting protein
VSQNFSRERRSAAELMISRVSSTNRISRSVLWTIIAAFVALLTTPARAQVVDSTAWAAFEDSWANVKGYSATVTVFEQSGAQVQSLVFDYTFHKPSSATVHYDKGPNAGVTIVWNGGDTVVAHRGNGLASLFKKTFSLHDPLMTTIRSSSIDQLSFSAILAHSHGTPGTISQSLGPTIIGVPTEAVTLVPISSSEDSGLTHEIVDISAVSGLPVRVLGYQSDTLVRQVDFSNMKLLL